MTSNVREPFGGRYFGILDVEGDDAAPLMLFRGELDATRELERRQALHVDDDEHLSIYHHVLPVDIAGALWNSYDPDPRADNPLSLAEIVQVHSCMRAALSVLEQGRRPDPSSRPQRVLALLVAGPLTLAEIREKLQLEETQFRNTFNALQRVGKIRIVDQVPRVGNRGPLVVARWGLGR